MESRTEDMSQRTPLVLRSVARHFLMLALCVGTSLAHAAFSPPENLNPGQSATPTLDSSFKREAWMVYTYEIDTDGNVINAEIHVSNGVSEVENKILNHVGAMRFRPGTRDGNPVKVAVGPIVYTWILDEPRAMTESFTTTYEQAWEYFKQEDYDRAFDAASSLKSMPGRNAFEEIKVQILAASLASRWDDPTAELANLKRIVEFQSLADRNRFTNPYVEQGQYLMILERIQKLQLGKMMLADAELTLNKMIGLDSAAEATNRAQQAQRDADGRFRANSDVEIKGELTPIYPNGQGLWETRLSRDEFSLSGVTGRVESVYLACATGGDQRMRYPSSQAWQVPTGWRECKIEVAGRAGTRFTVHQLASGQQPSM